MGLAASKRGGRQQERADFVAHLVVARRRRQADSEQASNRRAGAEEAEELLEEAKRHLRQGDLRSAEHSLQHVARHAPKNLEAKVLLARVLLSQGGRHFSRAEDLFREVLRAGKEGRVY
jgi:Tfp pilus assembly protein PilF